MGRFSVLIADDHEPMHALVREILEPEFEVIDAVRDGHALVEAVQSLAPDVLVVDIGMPGLSGIEAVKKLRVGHEGWAVVFLTTHSDPAHVEQAIATGGLGYVVKSEAAEHLAIAVGEALAGRPYLSPSVRA